MGLTASTTRDRTTVLTHYKSLVRSHLQYFCPVWNPHKIGDTEQIESFYRTFNSWIWGVHCSTFDLLGKVEVSKLYVSSYVENPTW